MGVTMSQPHETAKVVVPPDPAATETPAPLPATGAPTSPPLFNNCWSCRVLSGCGLIGAGSYVYLVARKPLKMGYAPGPGTIIQMVVGISVACWGVVILTDPKGKAYRVG